MRSSRKAFTLIELLVVIAIIAILAAILFPVFAQARERARSANCVSNLKQIALALKMYQQDYDEKMITPGGLPRTNAAGASCDENPRRPDGQEIVRMMGGGTEYMLRPYIKNSQIFKCPSDNGENYWGRSSTGWPWSNCDWFKTPSSYHFRHVMEMGDNGWGSAHNDGIWVGNSEAGMGRPSSLVVFYEAASFHQEKLPLFGGVHPEGDGSAAIRANPRRTFNASFADGHVKVYRMNHADPAWDTNHDMNWVLYGTADGGGVGGGSDFKGE